MLGLAAPITESSNGKLSGDLGSHVVQPISLSLDIPTQWMSAALTFQLTYDLVYLGWSAQGRRTMWPSTPLQLPLPSVPNASGWHDGPACFPNPFSPDRGGGPQGLLVTGFPWHRLSLRCSSLCDSLPSLHSAFLSGDVMTSDLSGKRGRKMLTSSFFYCGHSEKSFKVLTASPPGSKPQKAL